MLEIGKYINKGLLNVRGDTTDFMKLFDQPLSVKYGEDKIIEKDGIRYKSFGEYDSLTNKRIARLHINKVFKQDGNGPYLCYLEIGCPYIVNICKFDNIWIKSKPLNITETLKLGFVRFPVSEEDYCWANITVCPANDWKECLVEGMRLEDVHHIYKMVKEFLSDELWQIEVEETFIF